jgi:huntingtin-interacting protein 1-related protein
MAAKSAISSRSETKKQEATVHEDGGLMLQQYERRTKDLAEQLSQLQSKWNLLNQPKDDQVRVLQEQVTAWRSKYEVLSKLYTQEHLDLIQTTRSLRLQASSAKNAIEERERLEREMKTKNLQLADMLQERDRALHEKDQSQGRQREEVEKLKRELLLVLGRAE